MRNVAPRRLHGPRHLPPQAPQGFDTVLRRRGAGSGNRRRRRRVVRDRGRRRRRLPGRAFDIVPGDPAALARPGQGRDIDPEFDRQFAGGGARERPAALAGSVLARRGRDGCLRRRLRGRTPAAPFRGRGGFDHRQHGADRKRRADRAAQAPDRARDRRRNLHHRLVGLDIDDDLVGCDGVALADMPVDDLSLAQPLADIGEVEAVVAHRFAIAASIAAATRAASGTNQSSTPGMG